MIIVELGVAGDEARKTKWIADMYRDLPQFPQIKSVLFFNALDHAGAWGVDLPTPDWRINEGIIQN